MKTFHVIVYGCQMNYSDAARIKAVLTNFWRSHVDNKEQADIVILDTCSVRQKSEDKVWWQLKELAALSPQPKVWLTGCMIQHNLNLKKTRTTKSKKYKLWNFVGTVMWKKPQLVWLTEMDKDEELKAVVKAYALGKEDRTDELLYLNHSFNPLFKQMQLAFPNVELFFRIHDTWMLPYILQKMWYEWKADAEVMNEYTSIIPHDANMMLKKNTKTAYVPISTGCSQFCAYCIVPYARGLEKHRPVEEIYAETKAHLERGAQEIVLLWQIVNKHPDFYAILKTISAMPEVVWLRYTSPYPTYYDENIFALHNDRENICPHIHMPMQAWSNPVLKKMFRGYTKEQYLSFVDSIRALDRPISLTTDIIVWFCDETEEDFQESLQVAEYSMFDMIYIGIYSPRPGTYGAKKYDDNVPLKIKKQRHARLNEVLMQISNDNNQKEIGRIRKLMIREIRKWVWSTDTVQILWYTDNMKNTVVSLTASQAAQLQQGEFIEVKITGSKAFTLFGEVMF